MLKQRVITAVAMVAVLALVLFWLPPVFFGVALLVIFTLAAWEWANLAGYDSLLQRSIYAAGVFVILSVVLWLGVLPTAWLYGMLVFSVAGWCLAFVAVCRYPEAKQWCDRKALSTLGIWLLLPCYCSLLALKQWRPDGVLVLLVIATIACADIGAYFSGRRFGRRKLAPAVSPGKTWEGVWGGLAANLLLAVCISAFSGVMALSAGKLVVLLGATAAISVLGDLFESLVKRERGVKDSSQLLPGHGGILDRIDGWMSAFPLFTLLYLLMV